MQQKGFLERSCGRLRWERYCNRGGVVETGINGLTLLLCWSQGKQIGGTPLSDIYCCLLYGLVGLCAIFAQPVWDIFLLALNSLFS